MDLLKISTISVLVIALGGCSQPKKESTAKVINVVTTNAPLYFFAKQLAPADVHIRFPMQAESDPAYWTPNTDSIALMQAADLIVFNGADYEGWASNVTLPRSKIVITSDNEADLLQTEESVTHSHGDEGEHSHGGYAMTTWMDLSLAGKQIEKLKNALADLDPESTSLVEQRYKALIADIEELDQQYKESLDTSAFYVFSHPVYQYFQRRYHLKGQSVHWEPDESLSNDMLHELEHLDEHHKIDYVIWEGEPLDQTKSQLESLGLKCITIQPAGGLTEDYNFIEIMKDNISNIKAARN